MKRCMKYQTTAAGRRCASFEAEPENPQHFEALDDLGAIAAEVSPLGKAVRSNDVLLGVGLGMAASIVLKKAVTWLPAGMQKFANTYWPIVGGLASGAALYMVQRRSNPVRGTGHLVGAVAGTAAVAISDMVIKKTGIFKGFADEVYETAGYGLLVDEGRGMNDFGLMVDEGRGQVAGFAEMAALSMGEDDEVDGLQDLVQMETP